MKLRSEYKDAFVEKHGVKLGLMSGFIKVCLTYKKRDLLKFVFVICDYSVP